MFLQMFSGTGHSRNKEARKYVSYLLFRKTAEINKKERYIVQDRKNQYWKEGLLMHDQWIFQLTERSNRFQILTLPPAIPKAPYKNTTLPDTAIVSLIHAMEKIQSLCPS